MPDYDIFVLAFVLIAATGFALERLLAPGMKKRPFFKRYPGSNPFPPAQSGNRWPTDPAEQLRAVMGADFEKRRLLSKSEARVLYAAEKAIKEAKLSWRVMAQVSLGEVLTSPDDRAYYAINAKRVDMLVISSGGIPIAAIEYQGGGHYQGTAAARDAVKKEALRKAGVRYIEVKPEHGADDVARELMHIAQAEQSNAGAGAGAA